jgi:hypothetical protein
VRRIGVPFFKTQMGKGAVTGCSDLEKLRVLTEELRLRMQIRHE